MFDPDRLRRIRNWQSTEFYARLVMRPLSILIMLVIGDWKWLTPNMVTTAANLAKLFGAALIAFYHHEHAIAAAIWIQVGLLLDHLDGTLARYRRCGTTFGAFYDKVSDAVTWLAISGAIGWAAYRDTGEVWLPIAAMAAAYSLLVLGYMKWIVVAENKKFEWIEATHAPAVPRRRAIQISQDPPSRTPRQWVIWFGSSLARGLMFEEVDLFFWIGVGLVIGRLDILCLLLVVSQGIQLVIMLIKRALEAHALDRRYAAR